MAAHLMTYDAQILQPNNLKMRARITVTTVHTDVCLGLCSKPVLPTKSLPYMLWGGSMKPVWDPRLEYPRRELSTCYLFNSVLC